MRRMPLVYMTSTLAACDDFMTRLHHATLASYLHAQPHRAFSEFNALGAFAEAHEPDKYAFIDTESIDMPPCAVDQMWSWGQITDEVMEKMRAYGLA